IPQWNLEVFGGLSLNPNQTSGAAGLPTSGAIIGGRVSAATLYFGSGTQLFNQALVQAGAQTSQAITALDPVLLNAAIARRQSAGSFGVRLGRSLGDRFALEFSVEYDPNDFTFTSGARAGIEATRASYIPALTRALASLPSSVTSATTFTAKNAQQLFALAALEINLKT